MWWKIYFWITLLGAINGITGIVVYLIRTSIRLSISNIIDILYVVNFSLAVLAVYAFIYKRTIFTPLFWLCFFWINILIDIFHFLYDLSPYVPVFHKLAFLFAMHKPNAILLNISLILFDIPFFYSSYQLSQRKFFKK